MTPHTRSEVGLPRWQRQLPSDPPLASEWLWCLICERAYPRAPGIADMQPCPYGDCKGQAGFYAWDWNRTRRVNPQYPPVPNAGVVYPLLGE
jgi:hypothetical protein